MRVLCSRRRPGTRMRLGSDVKCLQFPSSLVWHPCPTQPSPALFPTWETVTSCLASHPPVAHHHSSYTSLLHYFPENAVPITLLLSSSSSSSSHHLVLPDLWWFPTALRIKCKLLLTWNCSASFQVAPRITSPTAQPIVP